MSGSSLARERLLHLPRIRCIRYPECPLTNRSGEATSTHSASILRHRLRSQADISAAAIVVACWFRPFGANLMLCVSQISSSLLQQPRHWDVYSSTYACSCDWTPERVPLRHAKEAGPSDTLPGLQNRIGGYKVSRDLFKQPA